MKNFLKDSLGLACLIASLYFLVWILYGMLAPSVQYYNPEGEHSSSASQIVNGVVQ